MMLRSFWIGLCLLFANTVSASTFSDLIVFGDSLSDVGNTDAATFGFFPGGEYFEGRFSNGPVYAELLSQQLGLGDLTRSGVGGDNFAFGGAETAGPGGITGLFLNGLDEQIDAYLDRQAPDPNALHIIWAGANDLLAEQTNFAIPAGNIAGEIAQLHAAGAREFLVINLPDLGVTPRFNTDPIIAEEYSSRTDDFNAVLDTTLDSVEASLDDIGLRRFDIDAVFDDLLANPSILGLTNTTDAALNIGAANPNDFLFFDDLHPTEAVHARLADEILALLSDANRDGTVNAADFVALRDAGANASAIAAFQTSLENPQGIVSKGLAVPEPRAIVATFLLLTIAGFCRTDKARR